jgi:hypothetical protein
MPSDPPLPAKVGRYEVVRLLGEGAMGRVLLAHDPVLGRNVAVKHLRGDLKIPREVRRGLLDRMEHEARASARVAHPNLVVLHDMGEDAAVGLYLVFEYVEGPTLKQRLLEGRLPAADAARLARELGAALTTAHEAGILHRDVKPENIMLARTGGKIADFGIARIPDSTLTHQGGLMGTPAYSAPETFRGGKFSPRSDQFSLAASIYEALSGERAFPGDDAVTVAARIANELPEPVAVSLGLPPAVDAVFLRALDRSPEARFSDCDAFGAALAESLVPPVVEDRSVGSVAAGTPAALPRPERRNGQVILGAVLVVATAVLVARTALRSAESAPTPAPEPAASVADVLAPTVSAERHRPVVPVVPHTSRPRGGSSAAPSAAAEGSGRPAEPGSGPSPAVADAGARGAELGASAGPGVPAAPAGVPSGSAKGMASARPGADPK